MKACIFVTYFFIKMVDKGRIVGYNCIKVVDGYAKLRKFGVKVIPKPTPDTENERKETDKMTFVGEYEHTLDAKNRVFMPARFREQLGENFFVTRKMNKNCLAVYTCEKMDQISSQINAFPDSEVSEIKEFLFSKSVQATPDSNGRIVLPQQILDYAKIKRDVVIIGAGDHIQIWNADLWRENEKERDIDKIRRNLASIGL